MMGLFSMHSAIWHNPSVYTRNTFAAGAWFKRADPLSPHCSAPFLTSSRARRKVSRSLAIIAPSSSSGGACPHN